MLLCTSMFLLVHPPQARIPHILQWCLLFVVVKRSSQSMQAEVEESDAHWCFFTPEKRWWAYWIRQALGIDLDFHSNLPDLKMSRRPGFRMASS